MARTAHSLSPAEHDEAAAAQSAIGRLAAMFPAQDRTATRIALSIYRQLAQRDRVAVQDIAVGAEVDAARVEAQLEAWPATYRESDGAVVGFWGLTGDPMQHRFIVEGVDRYTWCAWDALFIPDLIGKRADVQSTTPVEGRPVRLTVSPEAAMALDPSDQPLHVSFCLPEAEDWEADVIAAFCHHVFFLYEDEVERWLGASPGGVTLTLDDAFLAGRLKNERQFQR